MTQSYIQNQSSTRAILVTINLKEKRSTSLLCTVNLYLKNTFGKQIKVGTMLDKDREHFWEKICDYNFK